MSEVFVDGVSYVLGEQDTAHTEIPHLAELARQFRLAQDAALWGWGRVRVTALPVQELAARAGRACLRAAGADPASVEALVLCTNRIPGPAEGHGQFVADVLTGTGLADLPCYGQYLNRCVNALAGLDVARALVRSGRYRRILLVTADRVADGVDRIAPFALYSDGAAACLVSADPGGYELLGCATAQRTADLEWTREISSDLAREVNDQLMTPAGLKPGDVRALAHANLFRPLVMMKERQAGFTSGQLYLANIARVGHCFAADPLINLADRADLRPGDYCLLAASVPGSRIGALLRRLPQ